MDWTSQLADFARLLLGSVFIWVGTHGLRLVLILVGALIGVRVVRLLMVRLQNFLLGTDPTSVRSKRVKTLIPLIRSTAMTLLILVVLMVALQEVGIPVAPLLAAAGIGGLAIGFGAQSLVKDVISGFFFLIEEQVQVGDVVNVAGLGGLVEKITLRTVTLRDLAGNVHIVPHGSITTLTNMTKEFSRYVFNVGVAYREDPDEVMEVLREIGDGLAVDPEFKDDILEPLEMLGVDSFDDSAVIIKCRITTKPIQQWRVGREMNRRIKKVFDQRGIEIPFPHRTLYWGEPKQGNPPALHVRQQAEGEVS
jgi:small conductance mechanosensitive channel